VFEDNVVVDALAKYGSVFPKLQIVPSKNYATIRCLTNTTPKWFHNGIHLVSQPNVLILHNELQFNRTVSRHTGNYTCRGTLENGSFFTDTSELMVGGIIVT